MSSSLRSRRAFGDTTSFSENTDQHDGWVFDLDGFDPEQPMVVSSRRCGRLPSFESLVSELE
jgi:hypothetical protein